jgi:hypothetical protein
MLNSSPEQCKGRLHKELKIDKYQQYSKKIKMNEKNGIGKHLKQRYTDTYFFCRIKIIEIRFLSRVLDR